MYRGYFYFMEWKNITVYKYQEIVKALDEKDTIDKASKLISIIYDLPLMEVESMHLEEYIKLSNSLKFIGEDFKGKVKPYIKCNGKKYAFVWDVRQIPAARYIELKHFGGDFINNIHKLYASMVIPMDKKWYGWKLGKYDASKHEEYANDILYASIEDIYNSVVFFYLVLKNWIDSMQDYLKKQKILGMNQDLKDLQDLKKFMDGSTAQKW